jgi:hypothetical protein
MTHQLSSPVDPRGDRVHQTELVNDDQTIRDEIVRLREEIDRLLEDNADLRASALWWRQLYERVVASRGCAT